MQTQRWIVICALLTQGPLAYADTARSMTYNATAAVQYNATWVYKRNPSYPDLGDYDCTNFASQSLQAGGWKNTVSRNAANESSWYAVGKKASDVSYSWRAVSGLRSRLMRGLEKTATVVDSPGRLKAGDLIFVDFEGDGIYDHTVMVTGIKSGDPLLSYHSNNVKDIKFFDFKEKLKKAGYDLKKVKYTYMSIATK